MSRGEDTVALPGPYEMFRHGGRDLVARIVGEGGWTAFERPMPQLFFAAASALPGLIVVFEANAGNGYHGHAGIYVGDGLMISATYFGARYDSIDNWSSSIARLLGYVYPPPDWPGAFPAAEIGASASTTTSPDEIPA